MTFFLPQWAVLCRTPSCRLKSTMALRGLKRVFCFISSVVNVPFSKCKRFRWHEEFTWCKVTNHTPSGCSCRRVLLSLFPCRTNVETATCYPFATYVIIFCAREQDIRTSLLFSSDCFFWSVTWTDESRVTCIVLEIVCVMIEPLVSKLCLYCLMWSKKCAYASVYEVKRR